MTASTLDIVLIAVLALLVPAVILWAAPSWSAGMQRLKLVMNTVGLILIVVPAATGVVLFTWGLATVSKEKLYVSILPFIFAYMMYDLVVRRHGGMSRLFGFGLSPWQAFLRETRDL